MFRWDPNGKCVIIKEMRTGTSLYRTHFRGPSVSVLGVHSTTLFSPHPAPDDYQAVRETIVLAPDETQFNLTLTIVPDPALESDERFCLVLSAPEGEMVEFVQAMTEVIILNDDSMCVLLDVLYLTGFSVCFFEIRRRSLHTESNQNLEV